MHHPKTSLFIGSFMSLALIVSPFAAFAQSDGHDSRGSDGNAFGHAIAQGWSRFASFSGNLFAKNEDGASSSSMAQINRQSQSGGDDHNGSDSDKDDSAATTAGNAGDPATTTGSVAANGDLPPVISGISSPTVIDLGATGTWTVSASDPQNGSLSYSVDWGDQNPLIRAFAMLAQPIFTQTATFAHVYAAPGTYTVKFTVKDDAGLTSNASVTVYVINNPNALAITGANATSSRPTSALVSWKTNIRANSQIWYGTTTPVDTSVAPQIMRSARVLNHRLSINRLAPGTTYYAVFGSVDASGDSVKAPETSFTTPAAPSSAPSIVSFTGPASIPALEQGIWTVNASDPNNSSLSYSIDWGDSPMMAMALVARQPVFTQASTFDHTYADPGTYTIAITAKNAAGLTVTATTSVAVTPAATIPAPVLSGINASAGSTTANLIWNTDQAADSQVWFGTSSAIDTTLTPDLLDPAQVTAHSEALSGLNASTTYFYVVGSTNGSGEMSTSSIASFATTN